MSPTPSHQGGVDYPQGFRANGTHVGIKSSPKPDLALVINDGPLDSAAAVFTRNQFYAAPVGWTRHTIADGHLRAVLLNSGCANACTGQQGHDDTRQCAHHLAQVLRAHHYPVTPTDIGICSTGLIGSFLPMPTLLAGIDTLVPHTLATPPPTGGLQAAQAIMTTDTHPKYACLTHPDQGWSLGAMIKGAGMIAPSLATMLAVITTDAALLSSTLDQALRQCSRETFDRLDIDGCCSTNDTVILLASGASHYQPTLDEFTTSLYRICEDLCHQLQDDAEGVTKRITITLTGAPDEHCAHLGARLIARDNLVKTAMFGADPNWGRVLAALGMVPFELDPNRVSVRFNGVEVFACGSPQSYQVDLSGSHIHLDVDLGLGPAHARILTTDLSHGYVEENSAYSS